MRIYKKLVIDIGSGKILAAKEIEHYGNIARAKGQSQTTSQSLPKWLTPYAKDFIEAYGREAFITDPVTGEKKPIGMPGDLQMQVAGFTPEQESAFGSMAGLTGAGATLAGAGGANAYDTLQGKYLDPASNPWLSGTFDAASRKLTDAYSTATAPSIMANAQRSGQFGSSAMNEALAMSRYDLGENLNNLATSIYGGNYAAERDRQLQTQGMLPNTLNTLYAPYEKLAGVGAQRQDLEQTQFDTAYGNAANRAEWPFNILSGFGAALGQAAGGGGTSTTKTSGGGMFGSVICTALHDFGLMDDETYEADTAFGRTLPKEVIRGYHRWAIPVANAMRRSPILTALIEPIALQWAKTMRAKMDGQPERETLVGRLLLRLGVPICAWLGRERRSKCQA